MMMNFNPRTPCGVRPVVFLPDFPSSEFQSSHLIRGATKQGTVAVIASAISIHAPHARCDFLLFGLSVSADPFQSTHLMRGATDFEDFAVFDTAISIHAPHARCDNFLEDHLHSDVISIHAPHAGCDILLTALIIRAEHFNPRTPCGVRR